MVVEITHLEPEVAGIAQKYEELEFPFQIYRFENGDAISNLKYVTLGKSELAFNFELINKMNKLIVYDPIIGREQKKVEEAFDDFRLYLRKKGIPFNVDYTYGVSLNFSCRNLINNHKVG